MRVAVQEPDPIEAEGRVRQRLAELESVLVALSGGVDSSLLAALAAAELKERALAVTGLSASYPAAELESVRRLCDKLGIEHVTITTTELEDPRYVSNTPDRCYFCKQALCARLVRIAGERGLKAVVDGTTMDDLRDHRPGRRAGEELGVRSPFVELEIGKAQVRAMARHLGLPMADRPSSPCLSSRIAYGVPVTRERLARVGEAEAALRALGFGELRVRLHDCIARIEVRRADLFRVAEQAATINDKLKALGFVYVTLDLAGLRSGSLLEVFAERPK